MTNPDLDVGPRSFLYFQTLREARFRADADQFCLKTAIDCIYYVYFIYRRCFLLIVAVCRLHIKHFLILFCYLKITEKLWMKFLEIIERKGENRNSRLDFGTYLLNKLQNIANTEVITIT